MFFRVEDTWLRDSDHIIEVQILIEAVDVIVNEEANGERVVYNIYILLLIFSGAEQMTKTSNFSIKLHL